MGQKTSGPDQRNCLRCGAAIGNKPRVMTEFGVVLCVPCHQQTVRAALEEAVTELSVNRSNKR